MILYECAQGSPEWHKARAGVITASMFSIARKKVGGLTDQQAIYVNAMLDGKGQTIAMALAAYKAAPKSETVAKALDGLPVGDFSDEAKNYAFRLAIERISGEALDNGFETWQMRRGHELEPLARMEHEARTGLFVKRAGFMTTDDGIFGVSVDGLIGDDGGSEYKCFIAPDKLRSIYIDNDMSEVHDQSMGGMWISRRKWWHQGLYCPTLEVVGKQFWMEEFLRSDDYIEAMEKDLWNFAVLVADYEKVLRAQPVETTTAHLEAEHA